MSFGAQSVHCKKSLFYTNERKSGISATPLVASGRNLFILGHIFTLWCGLGAHAFPFCWVLCCWFLAIFHLWTMQQLMTKHLVFCSAHLLAGHDIYVGHLVDWLVWYRCLSSKPWRRKSREETKSQEFKFLMHLPVSSYITLKTSVCTHLHGSWHNANFLAQCQF